MHQGQDHTIMCWMKRTCLVAKVVKVLLLRFVATISSSQICNKDEVSVPPSFVPLHDEKQKH